MLTDDEVEKIRQEERVRAEIRLSLSSPQKKDLWFFLNSSFGLWFLSSIAVGLITFGYSSLNQKVEENRKKNRQIEELDLEIEGRIYQLQKIKSRLDDSLLVFSPTGTTQLNSDTAIPSLKELWYEFKRAPIESKYGYYSVYQEFEDRKILPLIVELTSLVECEKEKESLKEVIKKILSDELVPIEINENVEDRTLKQIINDLRIDRWQKNWPNDSVEINKAEVSAKKQ